MDSGHPSSSFSQSSALASSSTTPRFRLTELLASAPHDRSRVSSLKGKQSQQDSSRSSRIYGPYHLRHFERPFAQYTLTLISRSPCLHAHVYLRRFSYGTKFLS